MPILPIIQCNYKSVFFIISLTNGETLERANISSMLCSETYSELNQTSRAGITSGRDLQILLKIRSFRNIQRQSQNALLQIQKMNLRLLVKQVFMKTYKVKKHSLVLINIGCWVQYVCVCLAFYYAALLALEKCNIIKSKITFFFICCALTLGWGIGVSYISRNEECNTFSHATKTWQALNTLP